MSPPQSKNSSSNNALPRPPTNATPTTTPPNQHTPTKADSQHTKTVTQEEFDLTGDETATTNSQMTKSLATTQNRFAELEAAIRRQQTAVIQHKAELALINTRALTTLSLVEAVSKNVLTLTEDTTKQLTALRDELRSEAELQAQVQRDNFSQMTDMIMRLTARLPIPIPAFQQTPDTSVGAMQSEDSDEQEDEYSDTMSTQTVETDNQSSVAAASPAHKKNKRRSRDSFGESVRDHLQPQPPPSDQDKSAQYKSNRTPDAGAL